MEEAWKGIDNDKNAIAKRLIISEAFRLAVKDTLIIDYRLIIVYQWDR